MGDGLKLSKDKRHRSSSSLAGVVLEGTRSERKLDIRTSIPEVDDQFALAEARCDDLQDKIDLVKVLKRKKKLKKRSMTRVTDTPPLSENIPFISVRTQPKKKVSQQAARLRCLEVAPNPTRGYLDPATVEQHRMIGQVRGYNQSFRPQEQSKPTITVRKQSNPGEQFLPRNRTRRARADGDAMTSYGGGYGQNISLSRSPQEVACGDDDALADFSDNTETFDKIRGKSGSQRRTLEPGQQNKIPLAQRRRQFARSQKEAHKKGVDSEEELQTRTQVDSRAPRRRQGPSIVQQNMDSTDDRPLVELFNNTSPRLSRPQKMNMVRETENDLEDQIREEVPSELKKKVVHRHPRRVKYRSRRYELPTVASQMKQAGTRYYYESGNTSNIPFIVSKSTAPSHNIGVNIQQVLNGLKVQQPLSGIPLTIAHHMGLGHISSYGTRNTNVPSLDNREINVIRVGQRQLRLPSYRCMSYNRLLTLYSEGEGMVPRFLRAISRPHYFYTSMYNLATNREDADAATSKGRAGSQEAKQSLAEYASLYKEYEHIEKCLKDNYNPELDRRKEELSKELASREEHIRRVVQEYRSDVDTSHLRASMSTAGDAYRHSTFKLNSGDDH